MRNVQQTSRKTEPVLQLLGSHRRWKIYPKTFVFTLLICKRLPEGLFGFSPWWIFFICLFQASFCSSSASRLSPRPPALLTAVQSWQLHPSCCWEEDGDQILVRRSAASRAVNEPGSFWRWGDIIDCQTVQMSVWDSERGECDRFTKKQWVIFSSYTPGYLNWFKYYAEIGRRIYCHR